MIRTEGAFRHEDSTVHSRPKLPKRAAKDRDE